MHAHCVIARNKDMLPGSIYNEWPISLDVAVKNYGQDTIDNLTTPNSAHKKLAIITAIELTPDIMAELGLNGDTLEFTVAWSSEPMIAKIGDYLTDAGYSISQHDMKSYELINL